MPKNSLFFLTFATVLSLSSVFLADEACPLVQDTYPGAQVWFNQMIQKYPQAHLEQVKFYVSDNYHSGPGAIYFPQDCLQEMHQTFFGKTAAQTTQAMWDKFAKAEWILLHESAHVINKDNEFGNKVGNAALLTFVALNTTIIATLLAEKTTPTAGLAAFVTANLALVATFFTYVRFQERRADSFANEHADKKALMAGMQWFVDLHVADHGKQIDNFSALSTTITDMWSDPGHPSPISRAEQILFHIFKKSFSIFQSVLEN